jgi:hypothetical protein
MVFKVPVNKALKLKIVLPVPLFCDGDQSCYRLAVLLIRFCRILIRIRILIHSFATYWRTDPDLVPDPKLKVSDP